MRSSKTSSSSRPLNAGSKGKARTFDYISNMILNKHDTKYNQTNLLSFENKFEDTEYNQLDSHAIPIKSISIVFFILISFYFLFLMQTASCECIYKRLNLNFSLHDLEQHLPEYQIIYSGISFYTRGLYISTLWASFLVICKFGADLQKLLFRLAISISTFLIIYHNCFSDCLWLHVLINNITSGQESSAKSYLQSVNIEASAEVNLALIIRNIYFSLLMSTIINTVFRVDLAFSLGFISLEVLGFHLTSVDSNNSSFILFRLILNIFSFNFVKILVAVVLITFTQYYLIKASTELWALYKSFKVSYNYVKIKFEEHSSPIFIISKKSGGSILYKNKQANKFISKISSKEETQTTSRPSFRPKENQANFKSLFKSSTNDFEDFILKLNKDEPIVFEYCFANYSRDDALPVFAFVSSFCVLHKGQESYFIQIIQDDNSFLLKRQLNQNLTHLLKGIEMVIEELNIPLDQAADLEKECLDNMQTKTNFRSQFIYNSPPVAIPKASACTMSRELFSQSQSDPKIKIKKSNVKSIVHQLISYFCSPSVGQSAFNDINECTSIKPKSAYSIGFYLLNLTRMLHFGTLSFEYFEKFITNNYCLTKAIDRRNEVDISSIETFSLKRSLSLKSLETPTSNSAKNNQTADSFTQYTKKETKRNPSTNGLILIESKGSASGLDAFKMITAPIAQAHFPQLNSVLDRYMKFELSSAAAKPFFENIINKLYLLTSKLGFSLNLNVQVNEGIMINKEQTELILFNVLYFILENTNPRVVASEKKILDHSHKDKSILIKVQKELKSVDTPQYNHLQITIKLKDRYQKISFLELRKIFGLIQKSHFGGEESCLSLIDKTRFFDFGILTAINLISMNTIGENSFSVTCNDPGHSSKSLGLAHQSDDVEIRFSVPCVTLATKDFFERDDFQKYEYYFNKVLMKIYKVSVARKQSAHEYQDFDAESRTIYDMLPDICKHILL